MTDEKKTSTKKSQHQSAAEENAAAYPDMQLGQDIHRLTVAYTESGSSGGSGGSAGGGHTLPDGADALPLATTVFTKIATEIENPSLYRHLQQTLYGTDENMVPDYSAAKLTTDDLKHMEKKHETKLQELEAAVEEAREQAGDMEVLDARIAVAKFCAQTMSCEQALQAWQQVVDWPKLSSGKKMDALMECARVASFYNKTLAADDYIAKAQKIADDKASGGADWDRRNRLKVYKALQLVLLHRDTARAGPLLLDCIATFSCTEMCSYTDFLLYAILSNILHLPRPQLKTKIIDGPEIRSVAKEIPSVINLVQSFYDCNYKAYLHAMVDVEAVLRADRYLHPHTQYWMRELHLLAYQQFLDAYQSVTLDAMAQSFGVSTQFLDTHCSRFIAANRLSAKIDKYGGVIVTNRPDLKNAQYRDMIQKGDLLLNRIQKLARVVDL